VLRGTFLSFDKSINLFRFIRFSIVLISLTDYRCKQLGPLLKFVMCTILLPVLLILWPVLGIVGSIVGGAAYGFLSPLFATFEAIEGEKENKIFHCFMVCYFCFISCSIQDISYRDVLIDKIRCCLATH